MQIRYDKRNSGIALIGDLPWGSHFCQFYRTKKDLLDILAPYFRAGLENNEFCIWITSDILNAEDGMKVLKQAVPGFEQYAAKGQIEMIPQTRWRLRGAKSGKAVVSMLDKAISKGFDGLRLACCAIPEKSDGKNFAAYGAEAISRYNAIGLFAYPRQRFDAIGLMDVVKNHRFALLRNADTWEVIESSEARTAKDELKRSEEKLQSLFSNMSEGFAYHRIVLDAKGKPFDFVFLEVNEAFQELTGLFGQLTGKRVSELMPGIENDPADWIGKFGKVALTGKPLRFQNYSVVLKKWYSVSAFSPHKGYFAVVFRDITKRKEGEKTLQRRNERLALLADSARLLLSTETPEKIVQSICKKVMEHLDCGVFFNYLLDDKKQRLRLNAYAGIPEETAKEIEWLDFGVAVCGCVIRDGTRIIAENILNTSDERTELVKSFGMQAYVCHPLVYQGRAIGTLSFGASNRPTFTKGELELIEAVTDQVATAMARKRSEQALKESEERYRRLVETASEGIWQIDSDFRTIEVNERMAEILGYRKEEIVGCHMREFMAPEEMEDVKARESNCRRGLAEEYERRLRRKDGSTIWALVSATPLRDSEGNIIGSFGMFTEITERKKAEEQARAEQRELSFANRVLRVFVEHDGDELFDKALAIVQEEMDSPHGIFGYIPQPGHLFCPSLSKMLHTCEVEGKCIHYPPEKWKGQWARALTGRRSFFTNEVQLVPPCHLTIQCNLSSPIVFNGESIGLLNLANKEGGYSEQDQRRLDQLSGRIAPMLYAWIQRKLREDERKAAEEALREGERRLARSQEIAHLGSWELDLVKNHLIWSDEVYRIFGLQPQEFDATYEAFMDAVHPDDRTSVNEVYIGSLRDGKNSYEIEHRIIRKDTGEVRFVHEKCEHFRDENGSIIRSTGMVHDITERKHAEGEIKALNEELKKHVIQLQAANRELEAFSYSVSHDLRSPLRSISGFSLALLEDYANNLDAEGRDFLDRIIAGTNRMGQLIDDLLKLSRISRKELNCEEIDLSKTARMIIERLRETEPERRMESIVDPNLFALGDEHLLTVMLENLLGNAWKFTGKTPQAVIEFGRVRNNEEFRSAEGGLRIEDNSAFRNPHSAIFYVRDNGAGFDKAYADKLFSPFQRLHKSTEFPGTGIGLATVKRIIDRHGGKIWIEGEVEKGATVFFSLS